jgi:hypothetical protein
MDEQSRRAAEATNRTEEFLERKYFGKCYYDGLDSVWFPKCSAAKVTHKVGDIKLCDVHAQWYVKAHPFMPAPKVI